MSVQLRRVLLFALLGIVAVSLGASLAAPPTERQDAPAAPAPPPAPTNDRSEPRVLELSLDAGRRPAKRDRHRIRSIEQGTRVMLEVEASEPGQVAVEGLGRVASVEPDTPARFDLLLDRFGSYDVTFTPVGGEAEDVGTLLVEPEPPT